MKLMLVTLLCICLMVGTPQVDALGTPIVQEMFKYFGLQNLWSSFFGKAIMEKYNMDIINSYEKCYFSSSKDSSTYDDLENTISYYDATEDEDRYNWNFTIPEDYRTNEQEYVYYNRVKRSTKPDGKEAERYFRKGYSKLFKPIVANVTCMLKEMKMVNDNLLPNYQYLKDFIDSADIPYKNLRSKILKGYQFCEDLSKCIPNNSPMSDMLFGVPMQTLGYFKCMMEMELHMTVTKQAFDDYYSRQDIYEKYGEVWGSQTPTERGIMMFFYSMDF